MGTETPKLERILFRHELEFGKESSIAFCPEIAKSVQYAFIISGLNGLSIGPWIGNCDVVDLDHLASMRARKMAADCGVPLRWFDLNAEHTHLKEQYPDRKISVRAEDIRYGTVARKSID